MHVLVGNFVVGLLGEDKHLLVYFFCVRVLVGSFVIVGERANPSVLCCVLCTRQVHDEVILEGPEETAKEALAETVRCMEQPWDGVGLKELRVRNDSSHFSPFDVSMLARI